MTVAAREELHFGWNDLVLAGTLYVPSSAQPVPAVVMLQGSGPADRDCDGYFDPLRNTFLDRGMAVYSFDKPGCGESSGDWRHYALEDRSEQAAAAIGAVRSHPAIEGRTVGVWGQSQGGWLAQMLASRLDGLAFAIANSGPSLTVVEQNLYGCEHTMRAQGHDEHEIAKALSFVDSAHQAAENGMSYRQIKAELVEAVRGETWYVYLTVDDEEDWRLMCRFVAEGYEPKTALAKVVCPFLAVYGGRDVLVPAWRSAEECGRVFESSGHPDATIVVFPGGDHRIRSATHGGFVDGYLDLLGDWAAQRVHQ